MDELDFLFLFSIPFGRFFLCVTHVSLRVGSHTAAFPFGHSTVFLLEPTGVTS